MNTSILSYKNRNILILSVFLVVILSVGGYFILYAYPNKIHKFEAKITTVKRQISVLDGIEQQIPLVLDQIEKEKIKLSRLDKQIMVEVTPANTYDYFNRVIDFSGIMKFDLLYLGSKNENGYGYNSYNVKGEGTFKDIYQFIYYIENGPQIYRVNKINLRGVESKDAKLGNHKLVVPFELEVLALFADIKDLPQIHRTLSDVKLTSAKNPFFPYITRDIPPNLNNLVEVERAQLRAVMKGKAFILAHTGEVHSILEGDRVYLGYVTKIDADNNKVEFMLNKGGIVEKYILKISFKEVSHSEK